MDKRLALELDKARRQVKQKVRSLSSHIASSQRRFATHIQPLTDPIKSLISEIKHEREFVPKQEKISTHHEVKQPEAKRLFDSTTTSRSTTSLDPRFSLMRQHAAASTPREEGESLRNVTIGKLQETLINLSKTDAFRHFLKQWTGLPRQYIEDMIIDTENKFDHQYDRKNYKPNAQILGNVGNKYKTIIRHFSRQPLPFQEHRASQSPPFYSDTEESLDADQGQSTPVQQRSRSSSLSILVPPARKQYPRLCNIPAIQRLQAQGHE
ncbi:hypothetical protein TcasGA2_TC001857 [Tribolium castaneum]|uniref:Uncharacterized protein n=1 Tax=Tribolium castaneum TaxID=7070 RepID=D7ELT7_TRICA|nr:hypothetical protein TcasGA2_TC001857 [Tribolium castaneum]